MSSGVFEVFDWLNNLDSAKCETLLAASEVGIFPAGQIIFEPSPSPEKIYLLSEGFVRIFRISPGGAEFTLGFVHFAEIFGELSLFAENVRRSHAMAMEDSTVVIVDRDVFLSIAKSDATVLYALTRQVARRFRDIETRAEDLVFKNAEVRLARAVFDMVQCNRRTLSDDEVRTANVTVNDLAKLSGLSRPTASIALGGLLRRGFVQRTGSLLEIVSMSDMETLFNEN